MDNRSFPTVKLSLKVLKWFPIHLWTICHATAATGKKRYTLFREGPDKTDIQTTKVSPSVRIDTVPAILSLICVLESDGDFLLPDKKQSPWSVLMFNGEIFDAFEEGFSQTFCDTQQLHTFMGRTVDKKMIYRLYVELNLPIQSNCDYIWITDKKKTNLYYFE